MTKILFKKSEHHFKTAMSFKNVLIRQIWNGIPKKIYLEKHEKDDGAKIERAKKLFSSHSDSERTSTGNKKVFHESNTSNRDGGPN